MFHRLLTNWFVLLGLALTVMASEGGKCPAACRCFHNKWQCTRVNSLDELENDFSSSVAQLKLVQSDRVISDTRVAHAFESVLRLEFSGVTITGVSSAFVDSFPNVQSVVFNDSRFHCSAKTTGLRKWNRKFSSGRLVCDSPDGLAGEEIFGALDTIHLVGFQCPESCTCLVRSLHPSHFIPNLAINCSRSNLQFLPPKLPAGDWLIELDLSHNQIRDASAISADPAYRQVVVLNLAHNLVSEMLIEPGQADRLRLLNLISNRLTQLVTEGMEANLTAHQPVILLSGNPWMCDCHLISSLQTLNARQLYIVADFDHLTCSGEYEGWPVGSPDLLRAVCDGVADRQVVVMMQCLNAIGVIFTVLLVVKTAIDFRSHYVRGLVHIFGYLLCPSD